MILKRVLLIAIAALLLCGCMQMPNATTDTSTETTVPETTAVMATEPYATTAPDPIALLLDTMSIEQKVGQMFLARCPDMGAIEDIIKYHLGGFVLFGRDFEYATPESSRSLIHSYQSVSAVPMLIAVDEEGGYVTRVSCYSAFRDTNFSSPRKLFQQGGMDLIQSVEQEKCQLLYSIGINVNLAPVCDIATDPSAFMYRRSLGQDPQTTADFVTSVADIMSNHKIGCVLKHFPGYGNNADTHTGIAVDTRALAELERNDLMPFAAGIQSRVGAIMMSHIIVSCLDPDHPASLSPAVHKYLREDMGFNGVIVTDDLAMDAISAQYGIGEAAVLAILAGNDLLCSTNYPVEYAAVLDAVNAGRISISLIDSAVYRILSWKSQIGILSF